MKEWYVGEIRNTLKIAESIARYGLNKLPPAIISCAITGGVHTKDANPNLPESIDEQVQATFDAYNAGAVLVHIHTRDPKNWKEMNPDHESYMEVNARIREKCPDIIINNTFIGMRMYSQNGAGPIMQHAWTARPEVASLDITRMSVGPSIGAMTYPDAIENIKLFDETGIKPELECFDLGDFRLLNQLVANGIVKAPYWISVIFGGFGSTPCLEYLQLTEKLLPDESLLNVIGVGSVQTPFITLALVMGHHIRVGLEDNIYYRRGELAKSNAQLVERAARIATDLGRPLATPAQAREMMGLGAPRQYNYKK